MTTFTQSNRARGAMTKMKLILAAMLMMIGLQAKAEKRFIPSSLKAPVR